jgi:hypothetical protein
LPAAKVRITTACPPACLPARLPDPCLQGGAAFPQDLTGLPVLPSHFLQEAVAGFLSRLRQHQAAVAELEQVLLASSGSGGAPEGLPACLLGPGPRLVSACLPAT